MLLYLKNLLDSFQTLRRLSQDNDCREHQRHPGSVDSHGAVALFQELQEVHLSVFFIRHPCSQTANGSLQRAESTGLVRWALGSGTRLTLCWLPWQTAAPSVCTRAAVEDTSVTATANNLGWPVSWSSTQSGGEGGGSKVINRFPFSSQG